MPIFAEAYKAKLDDYTSTRLAVFLNNSTNKLPASGRYLDGHPTDLPAWQKYYQSLLRTQSPAKLNYPGQDVLSALDQLNPGLREIQNALQNPKAVFPLNYEEPFSTDLRGEISLLKVARIYALQGISYLSVVNSDRAADIYFKSFSLTQALLHRPLMVDYLVSVAIRSADDEILWEGIRNHAWSKSLVVQMEEKLAATAPLEVAKTSYRIERGSGLKTMDQLFANDTQMRKLVLEAPLLIQWSQSRVRPLGWQNQDRAAYCLMVQAHIDAIDGREGRVTVIKEQLKKASIFNHITIPLTCSTAPSDDSMLWIVAKSEAYRRLARMACRLEEYRIDHHLYPDHLDELPNLPPHLNQEVLSANPLHYWRKGDGYVLYSTGWDRVDHGGVRQGPVPNPAGGGTMTEDWDWTWPSP